MSGLHEALEELASRWADQPNDYDEDTEQQIADGQALRALLATQPAEPARSVEITDKAVEAATRALARMFATNASIAGVKDFRLDARAALEAALPYLAPAGDGGLREALGDLVEHWRYKGENLQPWQEGGGPDPYEAGLDDAATALKKLLAAAPAVPQPAEVSDEDVKVAAEQAEDWRDDILVDTPDDFPGYKQEWETFSLLPESAVPQPVDREALAKVLNAHYYDASWSRSHQGFRCVCGWLGEDHVQHVTDALLHGSEKPS